MCVFSFMDLLFLFLRGWNLNKSLADESKNNITILAWHSRGLDLIKLQAHATGLISLYLFMTIVV